MNLVAVLGMPAVGKTTLFREIMAQTGGEFRWTRIKAGLVVYHTHSKSKAIILGDYSQSGTFGGTDKLSMAVQKEAIKFIQQEASSGCPAIMFEGDRLANNSFFDSVDAIEGIKLNIIELFAKEEELARRHVERKDTQTDKWLAGRTTKIANIKRARPVERCPNSTMTQLAANAERILDLAGLLHKVRANS